MVKRTRLQRVSKSPEAAVKAKHEAARRAERAPGHAELVLPSVTVDTYNEELRDEEGFVGDRASGRAFRAILADWRDRLKAIGDDPLGDTPMEEVSKAKLDKMMGSDDPAAAALVHTVVEEFAAELATVGMRPGLGSMPHSGGTAFRVWAPHADAVAVTGSFTEWSGDGHAMDAEDDGHWYADIAGVEPEAEYQFVIHNGDQRLMRIDPRARAVTSSSGALAFVR